jgi:hypothetical protein
MKLSLGFTGSTDAAARGKRRAKAAPSRTSRLVAVGFAATALAATSVTTALPAQAGGYHEAWGEGGESPCSKQDNAYARTQTHDVWRNEAFKLTVEESESTADYLRCNRQHTPVKIKSIKGYNDYEFSGPKLDKVVVGTSLAVPLAIPALDLGAEFTERVVAVPDTDPASCENCSHLEFNKYGLVVSWQSGVVTHYVHNARAVYTREDGSTVQTISSVDRAF